MRRLFLSVLCFCGATLLFARAADIPVEPTDLYKSIDTRLAHETVEGLKKSHGRAREVIIKGITDKPELFAPPVLYFLSQVLFEQGQKDDAMFWFYAGQLRARIDANICADPTARGAVGALNEKFGPRINQYAFKDIPKLTNTVEKVLAWEETTPCNYDRRWINLNGMNAMNGDTNTPLSAPHEQWEKIRDRTREEYRATFYQALAEYNKMKHQK